MRPGAGELEEDWGPRSGNRSKRLHIMRGPTAPPPARGLGGPGPSGRLPGMPPAPPTPDEDLRLALELVETSGPLARSLFETPPRPERKADRTPVTEADRRIETLWRERIRDRRPEDGILGEEHGGERLGARRVWVLDPIDGTRAFVAGIPLFGSLVALCEAGEPALGVIDHPALGERWVGSRGRPTLRGGRPQRARACPALAEAHVATTSPRLFAEAEAAGFARVAQAAAEVHFGGDCFLYGLVASGRLDLVVEAGLAPHDFCAVRPVVEGAGGIITDWEGRPLTLHSKGRVVAAGDRRVHAEALRLLGRGR